MAYMARLITITQYGNVTDEFKPFIEFQAAQKKLELSPDTRMAILQVEDIPSYYTVFLDIGLSIEDIEKELEAQELILNQEIKDKLAKILAGG